MLGDVADLGCGRSTSDEASLPCCSARPPEAATASSIEGRKGKGEDPASILTGMEWVTKIRRIPSALTPRATNASHARRTDATCALAMPGVE